MVSTAGQYDLARTCNAGKEQAGMRSPTGKWIFPVILPNGGRSVLFKILISSWMSYSESCVLGSAFCRVACGILLWPNKYLATDRLIL